MGNKKDNTDSRIIERVGAVSDMRYGTKMVGCISDIIKANSTIDSLANEIRELEGQFFYLQGLIEARQRFGQSVAQEDIDLFNKTGALLIEKTNAKIKAYNQKGQASNGALLETGIKVIEKLLVSYFK